jgi:gliding motility-associated-like protein
VSLANGWKPGTNTIVVQVASSAPIVGLLVQSAVKAVPPLSDTIKATICEGKTYNFGTQKLTKSGQYLETFHPAPGCDSSVTLFLKVIPSATTIDTSICQGENYFGHTASGTYTDTYTSSTGCDSVRTVNLTVFTNPHPNIEKDSLLCMGDSLIISPGTFISYLWQDGSTLDHYVVKKPGLYTVTVTSTCGAIKSAVYVNEVSCAYIGFPTAFTPNQDGHNDVFKILTHQTLPEYKLVVYNRFGQKIFETRDPAKGWDGNVSGKQQGTGSYVWFCTFKKGDNVTKMQGTVVLLR